jgi:hypothetical protein
MDVRGRKWGQDGKDSIMRFIICTFPCALTKHHAKTAYWESGGIAPLILRPWHLIEVSGQLHAPAALPLGKAPLVPIG